MIEKKKYTVDNYTGGGGYYGLGNTAMQHQPVNTVTEEREFVMVSDLEKFRDEFVRVMDTQQLCDGEKVFFDPKVVFPRKKFKETYPKNPITFDVKKADVIILDKFNLKNEFNYWYCQRYDKLQNGHWTLDYNVTNSQYQAVAIPANPPEQINVWRVWRNDEFDRVLNRVNQVYSYQGRKLVDIADINLASDETLSAEAYDRISKMLQSGTDDMKNMAMRVLTAYDYQTEKHRIALLLHMHWKNWIDTRDKKPSVEVKAMLRKLSIDYPGYDNRYANHLAFWSRVALESPEDSVVQAAFNSWFHSQINDPKFKGKRIKIILEDEQDTTNAGLSTP